MLHRLRGFLVRGQGQHEVAAAVYHRLLIHSVEDVLAAFFLVYQSCLEQQGQVMRGSGLLYPNVSRDLADGARVAAAELQNPLARRVSHGFAEGGGFPMIHTGIRIDKHQYVKHATRTARRR